MHVSIPQSASIIDKTYADLSAMATAGTLVPGQLYRITDFRTKHLIPNTTDYNTGPTEVLVAQASTASTLYQEARSESYPQDIIYYELTDSSGAGGDRGRIYFRHDTAKNISVTEDFRNTKYRRWETAVGSGLYYLLGDPGGGEDNGDFLLFGNGTGSFNIKISQLSPNNYGLCNIVFMGVAENSSFNNCVDYTFADSCSDNIFTSSSYNIFEQLCVGNVFNAFNDGITAKNIIKYNIFEPDAQADGGSSIGKVSHSIIGPDTDFKTGADTHIDHCIILSRFLEFNDEDVFTDCVFKKGMVPGTNSTTRANIGATLTRCEIDPSCLSSATVIAGLYSDKKCVKGFSSFEASIDITGLTTLDITAAKSYVGIINTTTVNATETIDTISNQPVSFDYEIKPETDLVLTLTGTAYASVNADGQILLGAATRVLNGAKKDSIKLRKETITNGNGTFTVAREVGVNISL